MWIMKTSMAKQDLKQINIPASGPKPVSDRQELERRFFPAFLEAIHCPMLDVDLEECLVAGGPRQEEEGRICFNPVTDTVLIRFEPI